MPDGLAGARRWIASTSVAPANGATRFVIDRDGLRDEVISELPRIDRMVAGTHGGAARTARQRSRVRPRAATATCSSNSQTTDADFGIRTDTAWRLWRPVTGRRHGRPPDRLTRQRRYRLGLALRALDTRLAGASYRVIAAGLFSDAYIRAVAAGKRMICATGPFAWSAPARS
jgi:hypothetical protein